MLEEIAVSQNFGAVATVHYATHTGPMAGGEPFQDFDQEPSGPLRLALDLTFRESFCERPALRSCLSKHAFLP